MNWRNVSSGSFENIRYETKESGGEYLHIVTMLGPMGLQDRIPVFRETLNATQSENYFVIADNRKGYENILSVEDMSVLGDMLYDAGIRRFYNAVVTNDAAYGNITRLVHAVATTKKIETESIATSSFDEAEKFIFDGMKKLMKRD
ncbi:MAG: hypothetical protein K9G33_04800 [Sneathiella sp.]|nr:hypothetical protein [Sneathiella sp.]